MIDISNSLKSKTDKSPENNPIHDTREATANVSSEQGFQFDDQREQTSSLVQLQQQANSFIAKQPPPPNNTGLPDNLKSGIENLSGISMDDVKVHRNSDKPAQLNAHAYAQGNQIHLASGQEKHLPHEAWHVVQQKQGRVKPTTQLKNAKINDDVGLEKEADVMGANAQKSGLGQSKKNENDISERKTIKSQTKSLDYIRTENIVQRKPDALDPTSGNRNMHDTSDWDLKKKKTWLKSWEEWRRKEPYNTPGDNFSETQETFKSIQQEVDHEDRKATDPTYAAGHEFDTRDDNKKFKPKPEEVIKAKAIINNLSNTPKEQWIIRVKDVNKVIDELEKVVENPELMDQKGYPLCGPDTLMRTIAMHNPSIYAQYVVDLFVKGKARLGKMSITVPQSVKDKNIFAKNMRITDWIATASLRAQKNKGYKIRSDQNKSGPRKWHSSLGGSTTQGTMKDWISKMGIGDDSLKSVSRWVSNATTSDIDKINAKHNAGFTIALAINPKIIGNKVNTDLKRAGLYNHWVVLTSRIIKINNNYLAEIYTWGKVSKVTFKNDPKEIAKAIKGYLAYDPAKLQPSSEAVTSEASGSATESNTNETEL